MAGWQKVTLTPEEEAALQGGAFFKFAGVGSKMLGKFVKSQPQTGQFAKKDREDWVFRAQVTKEDGSKAIEEVSVNPTKKLQAQLKKCNLKPGYAVKITLTAEIDIGMANKMPEYDVEFDPSPAPAGAAKPPPPPPPPAAGADDDLNF